MDLSASELSEFLSIQEIQATVDEEDDFLYLLLATLHISMWCSITNCSICVIGNSIPVETGHEGGGFNHSKAKISGHCGWTSLSQQ